jgi:TonB family protein
LLGSTLAAAQGCRGFASLQRRPIQLFTSAVFGDQVRSYAAGVAFGTSGAFGELELGAIDIDAFSASSFTLGGGAGYQVALNKRGTAQLCPIAEAEFARGPKDINGTGIDYSETDLSFGVAAGVMATGPGQPFEVVPTGSIAFANAKSKLTGASVVSSSESFAVVGLGVGFVLGQEVSVTPSLSHAFGASGASTTLGIRVAFAFGGARTPVIASPATSCAGLASTDSAVYDTTQVTERPGLRSAPLPRYPPMQRELGVEGRVIVAVVIGPDGTPDQSSLRIVENVDPAIDREALHWFRRASYWPACRDGRPVRARIAQPVAFCVFGCRRRKP